MVDGRARSRAVRERWALAVLLAGMASASPAQLYKEPGHIGELPDPEPKADRSVEVVSRKELPKRLECGTEYYATIRVTKPTDSCDPFNYAELYRRAVESANALRDSRRCPAECSPPRVFQIGRKSKCWHDRAQYELKIGIVCPKGAPPTDLDPPTAQELGEPTTVERPKWSHVTQPETTVNERLAGGKLSCPSAGWVLLTSKTTVRCDAEGFDYEPYVDRALAESQEYFDSYTCAAPCQRSKWETAVAQKSWKCLPLPFSSEREVIVQIWMKLECSQ